MRKGRCARYLKIFLMKSESLLGIQKMKERFEHFMQMVGIFDPWFLLFEPRHAKTNILHMQKQRHRSASR